MDQVDSYSIMNFTTGLDFTGDQWGIDLMLLNAGDKDGMNSSMTDVFGVAGTGIEYIPCLLYTSPSPRDVEESRMPSSA